MSCSLSLTTVTSPAPSSAPHTEPAPPMTTISKYSMLALRPNGVGFTLRCMCA